MHRLVIGLVALIALTGALFLGAYLLLFSTTDRAAALAPAHTEAYVTVYLQPSTSQQANLSALIGRLPGFADDAALDEKVDQIAQNLLAIAGVDYRDQLKPWLGDQVAVAAWPSGTEPEPGEAVVIVDVQDVEAAEAAITDIGAEQGISYTDETYKGVEMHVGDSAAYAFVDQMLIASDGAAAVRAVLDTRAGAPNLGDRPDFGDTMRRLPDDHLAASFFDLVALAGADADAGDAAGDGAEEPLAGYTTAGAVLVAEHDGLRISGVAPLARPAADASPGANDPAAQEPSTLVEWMPADTVVEVAIFGLSRTLTEAESAARTTPEGEELSDALDTLRAVVGFGLGIDIDTDVLPLFDREVALAIGIGADGAPTGTLLLRPADAAGAIADLDRIAERLAGAGGTRRTEQLPGAGGDVTVVTFPDVGEVAYASSDGIVILGLGVDAVAAAVDAHENGNSLAGTQAYRRTFEIAGGRAGTEAFVDVARLLELLGLAATLPTDAQDILGQIGAFGLTAAARDDQLEFEAVLTIEEAGDR